MIYRIAICDDEDYYCTSLRELVKEFMDEKQVKYEIDIYHDGVSLRGAMAKNDYDLLFLDVEMPGSAGTVTAELIRRKDHAVQIIFVTSYDTFTKEAFDVEAIGYVVKPVQKERLFRFCERAFAVARTIGIESMGDTLDLVVEYAPMKILHSSIFYIRKLRNKICVHTIEGHEYNSYTTLKKVMEKLDDNKFAWIDKGIIANWDYVTDIKKNCITLEYRDMQESFEFPKNRFRNLQKLYLQKLREQESENTEEN